MATADLIDAPLVERAASVLPQPADLDAVRDLYNRGLYMQAYDRALKVGRLESWQGTSGRVLAGRLAGNLGGQRLARVLHSLAWRGEPSHPEARYYYAHNILGRRGPWAAWRFLRDHDAFDPTHDLYPDWLALHGDVLGKLRDFDAAEKWMAQAEAAGPKEPWICVERSGLFEAEDRYEEAVAAARRSLTLQPWFRPGVQALAHLLQLRDRDREALDLLEEASRHLESSLVLMLQAVLQAELGYHADAQRTYARVRELSPLLDKPMAKWLAARSSEVAYYAGNLAEAAEWARQVEEPYFEKFAARLAEQPESRQRVQLEVPFVRQHHQTCVPATLSALTTFWKMPADHLEVAAAVCYDGTPDHRERSWAEEHGWVVREFAVTWDSARALLDRGVPFTITVTEPTSSHSQAAIGYDCTRSTLIYRDPYMRYFGEYQIDTFFERYRSTGPRGMAMVPAAHAGLLEGLDLPDSRLYDQVYRLQRALQAHDRTAAASICAQMQRESPGHRLSYQARAILANYDADQPELLRAVEGLLELFPDDPVLVLRKYYCLQYLARRDERVELLKKICERKETDPIFWRFYAQELAADAREATAARHWLRRALRLRPADTGNMSLQADQLWEHGERTLSLELYRFASCIEDKHEGVARTYFRAARCLNQLDDALAFLRKRFEDLGKQSSLPAQTLFWSYSDLERMPEGFAVLDRAVEMRPEDAGLRLFAAQAYLDHGKFERAAELLEAAKAGTQRASWLRASAQLAMAKGQRQEAIADWHSVLETEPLACDAHSNLARLLAESEGPLAGIDHLRQACARFPHHYQLQQILIEWLRREGPAAAEEATRQFVRIHPADAWARRELATLLSLQGQTEAAFAELEVAGSLEPRTPYYFSTRGLVCSVAGQLDEAREAYQEALRISIDNEYAMQRLVQAADTLAERRQALAFVKEELVRQVTFGDGLLAFQQCALDTYEPAELLTHLQEAWKARPDLWHAWSAFIRQLVNTKQLDEALGRAKEATERFPLLPRLWFDLADVHQARLDKAGEIAALEQALQISPSWSVALRRLADVHDRAGDLAEAQNVLERAVQRSPLDYYNHGCLADVLWRRDQKEQALEAVQSALRLEPGYDWGWRALRDWSMTLERPDVSATFARELAQRRGGEARSWLMLARTLGKLEELDERLAALDKAIALNPSSVETYDLKAEVLARAGRHDEALAACKPALWDEQPPLLLQGRVAWIEELRGNRPRAIELMEGVVAQDPNYYWGSYKLTEWLAETDKHLAYLKAAEQLVRLTPDSAMSYGFRGEAKQRNGDSKGAVLDYQHSIELDSAYTFGGLCLFDIQYESDWEAAEKTLEHLKKCVGGDLVKAREVRWAAGREGKLDEALRHLQDLAKSAEPDNWPLDHAIDFLVQEGWARDAETALEECLDAETVHPHAGRLWINLRTHRRCWKTPRQLDALLVRGEIGRRSLLTLVEALGRNKRTRALRSLVRRYETVLRGNTENWGTVGYGFSMAGDDASTVSFLADWAQRADARPWMLINLVLAMRALKQDSIANQVSMHARTLQKDRTSQYHELWLAFDLALECQTSRSALLLSGVDLSSCDATNRFLHSLVVGLQSMQEASASTKSTTFASVRRQWLAAAKECSPLDEDRAAVLHAYRQAVRRLAHDRGGLQASIWSVWRRVAPRIPKPTSYG